MPINKDQIPLAKRFFNRFRVFVTQKKQLAPALAKAILNNDKTNFHKLMKLPHLIDKNYCNKDGNTLVHLILLQSRYWTMDDIESILALDCPLNLSNANGQKPIDCCNDRRVSEQQKKMVIEYSKNQAAKQLEKRREVLEQPYWEHDEKGKGTRVAPGKYIIKNLSLEYGSKNPHKKCMIPDSWEEMDKKDGYNLTLHQRLSIAEPVAYLKASNLPELVEKLKTANDKETLKKRKHPAPSYEHSRNYVAANMGFVVSTKEHKQAGTHQRTFITLPIDDSKRSIIKAREKGQHSEITLYQYLKDTDHLKTVVTALQAILQARYGSSQKHKIYAVVLDIHTSRDMCQLCEKNTYELQSYKEHDSFLRTLERVLKDSGFVLPSTKKNFPELLTPKSQRLKFVTRASSSMYNTFNSPRPKEIIKLKAKSDSKEYSRDYKYPLFKEESSFVLKTESSSDSDMELSEDMETLPSRDVKKFSNSVIIHDHDESYDKYIKFYKKNNAYFKFPNLALSHQTIFANTNTQTEEVRRAKLRKINVAKVESKAEKKISTSPVKV